MAEKEEQEAMRREKEKQEAMWRMSQVARDRFNTRCTYEWKLNIALWTPMAVATAVLLRDGEALSIPTQVVATMLLTMIFVCYVVTWRLPLEKANLSDRQKSVYWENRYLRSAGVDIAPRDFENLFPEWVKDAIDGKKTLGFDDNINWPRQVLWTWSVRTQCFITLSLTVGLLFAIWRSSSS